MCVFQHVVEHKFFSRAISNDKKLENEILIQWEAIQWTNGAGQKLHAHGGESQLQLLRACTQNKTI